MNYFLLATELEAGALIHPKNKIDDNCYKLSSLHFIFITGMGRENVKTSIPKFNLKYAPKATNIINIGIAGAVNNKLEKFQTYEVGVIQHNKKVYKLREGKNNYSFNEPVWQEESRKLALDNGADLVDMEAFFIYELLSRKEIFRAIKVVSDFCYKPNEEKFQRDVKLSVNEIDKFIKHFINGTHN